MKRFNRWCWFCQDCAEARKQELLEQAAERERRRKAFLLKQFFKGVQDDSDGKDTGSEARATELPLVPEQKAHKLDAKAEGEGKDETIALPQMQPKSPCEKVSA